MNYPFVKKTSHTLTRIISVAAAVALFATMFSGCFKKEDSDPSATASLPNLVDNTSEPTTETPTTEVPTTETEAPKTNVAIVKEQVTVRSLPSMEGNPISQLDAGDEVEINRVETVGTVQWAYIPLKGWVTTDHLDMSNVTISSGSTTTPAATAATTAPADTTAATTATTGSTGNTNTGTTGSGKYGVVTASELNIRDTASTAGNIAGKYTYGTRVTILETSNGWGRTDKGWVSMSYVYLNGATGTNTAKGIVTGTQLNIRSGPGTNYESVGSYGNLTRVNILEQITLNGTTWGCTDKGWISLDYVYIDGTTADGAGTGTVTGDKVNIRSGPGTNYDAVGSVSSGDEVEIYAQFTINNTTWGCTDKGWICMDYVGIG